MVSLESVINGDEAALRVLCTRHNVRIYRFVLRLTGDRSIAEEIVSDVFLEVWRHAARFGMKSQVSTWLLAILFEATFAGTPRGDRSRLLP
jgi:RNA polymerase sigma-70 factor (ECF subfamily)